MFGSKVLLRAYDVAVQPVRGVGGVRVKVLTFRAFDVAVQPIGDVENVGGGVPQMQK